jgi:hypothetical protein
MVVEIDANSLLYKGFRFVWHDIMDLFKFVKVQISCWEAISSLMVKESACGSHGVSLVRVTHWHVDNSSLVGVLVSI